MVHELADVELGAGGWALQVLFLKVVQHQLQRGQGGLGSGDGICGFRRGVPFTGDGMAGFREAHQAVQEVVPALSMTGGLPGIQAFVAQGERGAFRMRFHGDVEGGITGRHRVGAFPAPAGGLARFR